MNRSVYLIGGLKSDMIKNALIAEGISRLLRGEPSPILVLPEDVMIHRIQIALDECYVYGEEMSAIWEWRFAGGYATA